MSFLFKAQHYSFVWVRHIFVYLLTCLQTLVAPTFWLLQTLGYKDLFESLFSVLWGTYLGVELLGPTVILGLGF